MKKLFALCLVLIAGGIVHQAIAQPNWHRLYSDVQNKALDYTMNDEYLLTGRIDPPTINGLNNTVGSGGGGRNLERIQLQLLDNSLNSVWFKTYVANDEFAYLMAGGCPSLSTEFHVEDAKQVSNGDYIVVGRVRRDGETGNCGANTYQDLFLLRVDGTGMPVWYARYNAGTVANLYSVVETTDGGFMACGSIGISWAEQSFILKTDGSGNIQWTKIVDIPANWNPSLSLRSEYVDIVNYDNVCALVGYGNHTGSMYAVMVTIIDNNGSIMQERVYDNTHNGILLDPRAICVTDDNKLAISGNGGAPCQEGAHLMVMKIDPASMIPDFVKFYGPALYDPSYFATGIDLKCLDGKLCIAGIDYSPDYPGGSGLYVEIDHSNGAILRYSLGDANYYRAGMSVAINTNLPAPAISGFTTALFETSLIINEYNSDCYLQDIEVFDADVPFIDYMPVNSSPFITHTPDKIFAFDMVNMETTVCQPLPKMGGSNPAEIQEPTVALLSNRVTSSFVLTTQAPQSLAYYIADINGRAIANGTVMGGQAVDISHLASGFYIVKVRDESGKTSSHKFVKE